MGIKPVHIEYVVEIYYPSLVMSACIMLAVNIYFKFWSYKSPQKNVKNRESSIPAVAEMFAMCTININYFNAINIHEKICQNCFAKSSAFFSK